MKVIILDSQESDRIIEHFIAYGFDSFISYGKVEKSYYAVNGISAIELNPVPVEGTMERISKIRGSLNERFILAYSTGIYDVDLDKLKSYHCEHQCILTLAIVENKLCAAITEPEIFDYLDGLESLEREVFLKVAEAGEMQIYK